MKWLLSEEELANEYILYRQIRFKSPDFKADSIAGAFLGVCS
ncbi:hypothetical protein ACH50O_08660 [Methylomonas sp. 2BW1-5-20]